MQINGLAPWKDRRCHSPQWEAPDITLIPMKETWLVYDYLRRFWALLLLFSSLGGLAGLGYYIKQAHPEGYTAQAGIIIENPKSQSLSPPRVYMTIDSGTWSKEYAAMVSAASNVSLVADYSDAPVSFLDLTVDRKTAGSPWWKAVVFGGVLGTLLAVGSIYVWEDAKAYRRQSHEGI